MKGKTYSEIKHQYEALRATSALIAERREALCAFWKAAAPAHIVVLGCGSSFQLSTALASSLNLAQDIPAVSIPAGDLLVHPQWYTHVMTGALVITLSRSGETSELIYSLQKIRKDFPANKVLSVTCVCDSQVKNYTDMLLELPWAFDASVCQTSSVVNLYAALELIIGYVTGDEQKVADIHWLAENGEAYLSRVEPAVKELAAKPWNNVTVLCDGEANGLAEEGALAFNEIAYRPSMCKHILDLRHGPIVLIDSETLVLACLNNDNFEYQRGLIADVAKRGALIVAFSAETLPALDGVSAQFSVKQELHPVAATLAMMPIAQLLSVYKAAEIGVDPDNPDGLDAWIKLN